MTSTTIRFDQAPDGGWTAHVVQREPVTGRSLISKLIRSSRRESLGKAIERHLKEVSASA